MALIGLASDDSDWWNDCSCNSNEMNLSAIQRYFGTSYLRKQLKDQGENYLRRLMYEVDEAISSIKKDATVDNPYFLWDHRQDKIERDATKAGVWYTVIPTSEANDGVYGEVLEWMNAEKWPTLGDVEFLDEVQHPLAKDSSYNSKKYPPNTIRFRLKNSDVKKAFEADFKYLLGPLNLNM